jgi:hypothetical protein
VKGQVEQRPWTNVKMNHLNLPPNANEANRKCNVLLVSFLARNASWARTCLEANRSRFIYRESRLRRSTKSTSLPVRFDSVRSESLADEIDKCGKINASNHHSKQVRIWAVEKRMTFVDGRWQKKRTFGLRIGVRLLWSKEAGSHSFGVFLSNVRSETTRRAPPTSSSSSFACERDRLEMQITKKSHFKRRLSLRREEHR